MDIGCQQPSLPFFSFDTCWPSHGPLSLPVCGPAQTEGCAWQISTLLSPQGSCFLKGLFLCLLYPFSW